MRARHQMRCWICAAAVLVPGRAAVAQNEDGAAQTQPVTQPAEDGALEEFDDIGLLELEIPTVVTATRHEQPITSVPHAISVVTREDIRRSGARSVADALRLVPGVDVAELSYGNTAVSPRGFHGFLARQTLVLVDGRQIFDSFFGGTLWGGWPFQLEDIERIEVIRGPGGVTWGANAFNGVINVITRDPKDQKGLTYIGGGGSRGVHRQYAGYAYADEKLRFRISGELDDSEGFRRGGSVVLGPNDEYTGGSGALHAIFDLSARDTLTVSGGSKVVKEGFPRSLMAGIGRHEGGSHANYVLGRWSHEFAEDNLLELTGYVNDFWVSNAMDQVDYRYQQFALQLSHVFSPAENHTLSWGVDSRVDVVDAGHADPYMLLKDRVNSGIVGVYARDEWRFAERWMLDLGARVDYETYGGFQPSGRAALSYQIAEHSAVWGAVSRGFQMPPAALRFLDTPFLNGIARARSDRDMDASTLMAYEIGYRGRYLSNRLDLNINTFWHEMWDVTTLSPRLGPPGLIHMSEDNRASATLYGVELDTRYALTPDVTLLGNYTYQLFDWESIAAFHDKDLITPPRHKFMVGARYDATDDLHLSGHLYWVDAVEAPNSKNPFVARRIDPYFRLDLLAEYEFWKDRAAVSVGVRNLLDNHHLEGGTLFLNSMEVPRMVWAQLRVAID